MSHHLNLDAIRRNLLTSGLIDKDTAVVVLVQDRDISEFEPLAARADESPVMTALEKDPCMSDAEALILVCNERSKAWADLRKARNIISQLETVESDLRAEIKTLKSGLKALGHDESRQQNWISAYTRIKDAVWSEGDSSTKNFEDVVAWAKSAASEIQTLKAQNQGLASNQADMGVRARSDAWIAVVREIEKSSPDLLLASGCGAENALNWIKQSARLREIFSQGLAETATQ